MQALWSQNDRSLWLYILALNFRLKVYVDTVAATNLSPRREVKKSYRVPVALSSSHVSFRRSLKSLANYFIRAMLGRSGYFRSPW